MMVECLQVGLKDPDQTVRGSSMGTWQEVGKLPRCKQQGQRTGVCRKTRSLLPRTGVDQDALQWEGYMGSFIETGRGCVAVLGEST